MLLTIHVTNQGVRISRMHAGGEELVHTTPEVRLAAAKLWALVADGKPLDGYNAVDERIERLDYRVNNMTASQNEAWKKDIEALRQEMLSLVQSLRDSISGIQRKAPEPPLISRPTPMQLELLPPTGPLQPPPRVR